MFSTLCTHCGVEVSPCNKKDCGCAAWFDKNDHTQCKGENLGTVHMPSVLPKPVISVSPKPVIPEVDPELEKILAEEEEIEKKETFQKQVANLKTAYSSWISASPFGKEAMEEVIGLEPVSEKPNRSKSVVTPSQPDPTWTWYTHDCGTKQVVSVDTQTKCVKCKQFMPIPKQEATTPFGQSIAWATSATIMATQPTEFHWQSCPNLDCGGKTPVPDKPTQYGAALGAIVCGACETHYIWQNPHWNGVNIGPVSQQALETYVYTGKTKHGKPTWKLLQPASPVATAADANSDTYHWRICEGKSCKHLKHLVADNPTSNMLCSCGGYYLYCGGTFYGKKIGPATPGEVAALKAGTLNAHQLLQNNTHPKGEPWCGVDDCECCVVCNHCGEAWSGTEHDICEECEGVCCCCCECTYCYECYAKFSFDNEGCDACGKCDDCGCSCNSCDVCGADNDYHDWCDGCDCNSCECNCGGEEGGHGQSTVAPWEERGVVIDENSAISQKQDIYYAKACELWGVKNNEVDIAQVFCDFYVLKMMSSVAARNRPNDERELLWARDRNGPHADPEVVDFIARVTEKLDELVERVEPTLLGYCRMVVWGEARYHKVFGGKRSRSRSAGWMLGQEIEEAGGPEVYKELGVLFDEMNSGGIGGKKWGNAARLVHLRLTNRIAPWVFIDRALAMQHNGGSLFNKIKWPCHNQVGYVLSHIQLVLGPMQHNNPPAMAALLIGASDDIRAMWPEWVRTVNKARRRCGLRPLWDELSGLMNTSADGLLQGRLDRNTGEMTHLVPKHSSSIESWWNTGGYTANGNYLSRGNWLKHIHDEWTAERYSMPAEQHEAIRNEIDADREEEEREISWFNNLIDDVVDQLAHSESQEKEAA